MFGSQILEVAIGMIFIFLLVSIICSSVREGIEALLKTRAAYLAHGIKELLHDPKLTGIAKSIYEHPLINGLSSGNDSPDKKSSISFLSAGGTLPSYIPAKNFAVALMDIAVRGQMTNEASSAPNSPIVSLGSIRANIQNIGNPAIQRVMLTAIDSAQGDFNKAQANIEEWYNSGMDRVAGWYKRKTQWILFWIALAISIGLNVNTLTIANYLYKNDDARVSIVETAEGVSKKGEIPTSIEARSEFNKLELPIGWSDRTLPTTGERFGWIALLFGWLLTAFAASMGAPFWFDMLNKVIRIRSTIKPAETVPGEGSNVQTAAVQQPPLMETPAVSGAVSPPDSPSAAAIPSDNFPSLDDSSDPESSIDGCDVEIKKLTEDEDLPATEGGVEE